MTKIINNHKRPVLLVLASTYPRWRDDPEPGFVHELCRRLADNFTVVAVVPDAPGADSSGLLDGVYVQRYRYAPRPLQTLVNNGGIATNLRRSPWKWLLVPGFVVCQYLAARKVVRRQAVAVIHAHWLIPQGLVARWLGRGYIPYLVTSHGGDLFGLRGRLPGLLKRKVAASAAAMTVVSTAMCVEAQRQQLRPPQIAVIPMGVDMQQRFTPALDIQRLPNELLFVGRLVPKKGLVHLLNAMPGVLKTRPETMLTIAGFGPEDNALKEQARQLKIEAHIRFIGAQPQRALPKLYREAGLLVAPFVRDDSGNQEGLPVVLMEAIGCACPVVVGDVSGVRDLLGDAAHAVCVNPENTSALSAAIVAALEHANEARARAREIRNIIWARADWQTIANDYARIIEKLV